MKSCKITKDQLYEQYIVQQLSTRECAKYFNVAQTTIRRLLFKFKIPVRSSKEGKLTNHYKEFEDKIEANNIDNLVCLCNKCHSFIHSKNNSKQLYIKHKI